MKFTKNVKNKTITFKAGRKKFIEMYDSSADQCEMTSLIELLNLREGTKENPAFVQWMCPVSSCLLTVTDTGKTIKVLAQSNIDSCLKLFETKVIKVKPEIEKPTRSRKSKNSPSS